MNGQMMRMAICAILVMLSVGGVYAQAGPAVKIALGEQGLSSLTVADTELLKDGALRVRAVRLDSAEGEPVEADLQGAEVRVDQAANAVVHSYPWGTIRLVYRPEGERLNMTVRVRNRSDSVMGLLLLQLMELKFPDAIKGFDQGIRKCANVGWPTVIGIDYGGGVMALCNDEIGRGLYVGIARDETKPRERKTDSIKDESTMGYKASDTYPIIVANAKHTAFPNRWLHDPNIDRAIPPGGSDTFHLSLRFGPAGAGVESLAADVYRKFVGAYPRKVNWPDRRPIGMLFLGGASLANPEQNPHGWSGGLMPQADITTREGQEQFKRKFLAWADECVRNMRQMDCQGMIVWDIEGYESPGATYVGDPRSLPPEIEMSADEFFKKFTDAGLRVGCTLRPQFPGRMLYAEPRSGQQVQVADPAYILDQKVSYASKRWGATLFYVDSNSHFDQYGRHDDEGSYELMDASIFRKVARRHPEVLLIPEHENAQYYGCCAPYNELRQGYAGTPADVLRSYPDAFCVLRLADGPVKERWNELVRSVRRGDVIVIHGHSVDQELLDLQKQAKQQSPQPPAAPSR